MSELPFYSGSALRIPPEVLALRGEYRTDSLILSIAQHLEDAPIKELSEVERIIVGVSIFEREVNSGGFDGFLEYYSAYAPLANLGLTTIGRHDVLALLNEAESLHPDDLDGYDALDQTYYALNLDMTEDLMALLIMSPQN